LIFEAIINNKKELSLNPDQSKIQNPKSNMAV
jgi:hypothetical protein